MLLISCSRFLVRRMLMDNKTIGPKIKRFRESRKLTQEQLAESLGYSGKSVISHIEKGDADMTYEKILLLLKKYKLDANELFNIKRKKQSKVVEVEEDNVKRVAIYIHGLNGSADEAAEYSFLKDKYDVVGLDYQDGNPWELKDAIQNGFDKLTKGYQEVIVIANSIGAFYTYEYLSDRKIKKAFFISPIVSMFQQIINIMTMYEVKDRDLKKQKFMELEDGTVLSYDFYQHVSNDEDSWDKPTEILYGAYDEMVYVGSMIEFLESHPLCKLTVKSDAEHYFESEEEKEFIKEWILRNL